MGLIKKAKKVTLFFSIMYSKKEKSEEVLKEIKKKYGEIQIESEEYNFDFTNFYEKEFGKDLKKKIYVLKNKINREQLSKIKIYSNKIERKFTKDNKRKINIDPGYLTEYNVILASCKEFTHRIHIGDNVYAEVEMIFKKNRVEYPVYVYYDYKSKEIRDFFLKVRKQTLDISKTEQY